MLDLLALLRAKSMHPFIMIPSSLKIMVSKEIKLRGKRSEGHEDCDCIIFLFMTVRF